MRIKSSTAKASDSAWGAFLSELRGLSFATFAVQKLFLSREEEKAFCSQILNHLPQSMLTIVEFSGNELRENGGLYRLASFVRIPAIKARRFPSIIISRDRMHFIQPCQQSQ